MKPMGKQFGIDIFLILEEINGGRGRDRTYDQSIKSRMLYQLSYASNVFLPESGG